MVYYFGKSKTEGKGKSKSLLGGKGVNLAEMTRIGLPVPPGFTITTEVCDSYYKSGKKLPSIYSNVFSCKYTFIRTSFRVYLHFFERLFLIFISPLLIFS